jgi:hypothetical protein
VKELKGRFNYSNGAEILVRNKKYYIALLMLLAAFLSYNYNFFLVTNDQLFTAHQLDSEQLVLDGILHKSSDDGLLRLGTYPRPEIENSIDISRQLYEEQLISGEFKEYKSQFGLQLHFFYFISQAINRNVNFLQSIPAFLMSLIVMLFFIVIEREFSLRHALFFCLPLIFSPWVVIFARNLYWVEATWFLPTVITLYFGRRSLASAKGTVIMTAILFVSFLIKCLCGYEYLTTIGLSACVPLVYYAAQTRIGIKRTLVQLMICCAALSFAFSIALIMHSFSLNSTSKNPLNEIILTAKIRLSGQDPVELAKEFSKDAADQEESQLEFIDKYSKSLTCNRFMVAARYFVMPHAVPWIDRIRLNDADQIVVDEFRDNPSLGEIRSSISRISSPVSVFLLTSSRTVFLFFNLLVLRIILKRKDFLSLAVAFSILAPLSWFIIAKGHSYIHDHMNFVLWYLPYISFGMMLLVSSKSIKREEST